MSDSGKSPLRVFHVIDSLGTGGAERSLAEMLPYLETDGIVSTVWPLNRRGGGVEVSLQATTDVRFLDERRLPNQVRHLRRAIRGERPDIVHTTLFTASLVGRLAAVRLAPILTSLVNTPYDSARRPDRHFTPGKLVAVRTLDRATSPLSTHFHAITQAVADAATRDLRIPFARITVIGRGRSTERLGVRSPERRAAARRALDVSPWAPLVVNVARQEFQKGQRYLLEAAHLLRDRHPDLVVLVCGRGGAVSGELRALHDEFDLGDQVRILGHREDIPEILAAADVFAFPSLFEGLGGSLIEAMALGVPIVASDIPAIRETVVDGGCATLVEPGSGDALAEAVANLLDDASRLAAYADEGIRRFEEFYALPGIASKMAALYRAVAAGEVQTT